MATRNNRTVELRGQCPSDIAQAVDAIALAEGISRNEYIVRLITKDVERVLHKSSVIQRTLRGNPLLSPKERTDQ